MLTALSYIKQLADPKKVTPELTQEIKIFVNDIFDTDRFIGNKFVASVCEDNLRLIFSTSHNKSKIYEDAKKILRYKKVHSEITMLALRAFLDTFISLNRKTEKKTEKLNAEGTLQLPATPHADDLLDIRNLLFSVTPDGADAMKAFIDWQIMVENGVLLAQGKHTAAFKALQNKALTLIDKLDNLFSNTHQSDGWVWSAPKSVNDLWNNIKQGLQTKSDGLLKIDLVAINFSWLEDAKENSKKSNAACDIADSLTQDCLANTFILITSAMNSVLHSIEIIEKVYKCYAAQREYDKEDDAWNRQFAEWRVDTTNLRQERICVVEETLASIARKLTFLKKQASNSQQELAQLTASLQRNAGYIEAAKQRKNFKMTDALLFMQEIDHTKYLEYKKTFDLDAFRKDYLRDVNYIQIQVEELDALVAAKFSTAKQQQETERKLKQEQALYQERERKNQALQAEVEKRKASSLERKVEVDSLREKKRAITKVERRVQLPRIISEEPASQALHPETYKRLWELNPKDRQLMVDIFNKDKNIKFKRACTVYKRLGGNVNRKGGGSHHYFAFSFNGVSDTTMVVSAANDVDEELTPSNVATSISATVKSRMHQQHDGDTTTLSPMNVKFFTEGLNKLGITLAVMLELEDKLLKGIPFEALKTEEPRQRSSIAAPRG